MIRHCLLAVLCVLCLPARAQTVFINELHYDNASTDLNEAIEVAAPAGTDLTGWSLVLYNGNGGAPYATLALGGVVIDTCAGFGVAAVAAPGLQNGAPDGIALVDAGGTAVQFLSYEGSFTAIGGPADGLPSTDIGVAESGTDAADGSLQLTGTGTVYGDFAWQTPATASFGACNAGQTFVGGVDVAPTVIATTPADGAADYPTGVWLIVQFSESVDLATDWTTLTCTGSGPVTGTTGGGPQAYTFQPDSPLAAADTCDWTIVASAVTDQDGGADTLAADVLVQFTVAPDLPPAVTTTVPVEGASGVPVASDLTVSFSEPVDVQSGAFTLVCTSTGNLALNTVGGPVTFTLHPVAELPYLDECTLTVIALAVTDQDEAPDALAADVLVVFTTDISPADYYASADPSSAAALRATLHAIIDDHQRFPYTAASTDTWDILELADEDPADPARILDVYRNASYAKAGGGNDFYNREHTWAKSYGFPDDNASNWPYTDTHHLMLSDSAYNSARNNRYFDYCASACTEYSTLATNGTGGGTGVHPGNSNWGTGDRWEVWDERKGDVARAILYMDIRYEGGTNTFGAAEPDLAITDDPLLIQTTGTNTTGTAYLGLLTVLLEWHAFDPPDDRERLRNAVVYSYQGNRNPFVDHPEWAACIYEVACVALGETIFADGFEPTPQ